MKRVIVTIVCLIVMLIQITGCSSNISNNSEKSNTEIERTEVDSAAEYEDIVVETKYGNLYFPGKWRECLQVEQCDIENRVEVVFSAKVDQNVISLFSIVIGDSDDTVAGTLTDIEGKQRSVTVRIEELSENELISQDDLELLYSMQEDLNYLIDNLK